MRGSQRHPEDVLARPSGKEDAQVRVVKLIGLSQKGVSFECLNNLPAGQEVSIELPCVLSKRALVAWCDGKRCICEFVVPLRFQDVRRCYVEYTRIVLIE